MNKIKFYFYLFFFLALPNYVVAQVFWPNLIPLTKGAKGYGLLANQQCSIPNFTKLEGIKIKDETHVLLVCDFDQNNKAKLSSIAFLQEIPKQSSIRPYFNFTVSNDQRILRGRNSANNEEFKLISKRSKDFSVAAGFKNQKHTYEIAFRQTAWEWNRSQVNNLSKHESERAIYSLSYLKEIWPKSELFVRLDFQKETFYVNESDVIEPRSAFHITPKVGLQFDFDFDKDMALKSSHLLGLGIHGRMSGNPVGKSFSLGNSITFLKKFKWGQVGAGLFINNSELGFYSYENKHSDTGISLGLEIDL